MADDLNLEGFDLPREDELLARVVVDLGLSRAEDVVRAVEVTVDCRAKGDGKALAAVLQEMGSLHPRFLGPVMKAVNSRIASAGEAAPAATSEAPKKRGEEKRGKQGRKKEAAKGGAGKPKRPSKDERQGDERRRDELRKDVDERARADERLREALKRESRRRESRRTEARRKQAAEKEARRAVPPAGPVASPQSPAAPPAGRARAPATEAPAPHAGQGLVQGDRFSARSKEDVAAAWEAHKRGDRFPAAAGPQAPAFPPGGQDVRPIPLQGLKPVERPAQEPPAQEAPSPPAFPQLGPRRGRRGAPPPQRPKKGYVPKHRRITSSGVTQHIDVKDLRDELGIRPKAEQSKAEQPEIEAVPRGEKQKEVAMRAFVKRAMRGTLHVQCLESVLRRRLTRLTAARLSDEAGCRERDAKRVLDDWKDAGLVTQGKDENDMFHYQFVPAKADLETIREFMHLWSDAGWHQRMLGWVIAEEPG